LNITVVAGLTAKIIIKFIHTRGVGLLRAQGRRDLKSTVWVRGRESLIVICVGGFVLSPSDLIRLGPIRHYSALMEEPSRQMPEHSQLDSTGLAVLGLILGFLACRLALLLQFA
jgi:hypothetical protein